MHALPLLFPMEHLGWLFTPLLHLHAPFEHERLARWHGKAFYKLLRAFAPREPHYH